MWTTATPCYMWCVRHPFTEDTVHPECCGMSCHHQNYITGHFTLWISLSLRLLLSPKFDSLSVSLRPNFGLSNR